MRTRTLLRIAVPCMGAVLLTACGGGSSGSDSASAAFTWVGGSNTANAQGVYGTRGVAASTNVPGARDSAASWTDASGDLWLFGGGVYDSTGTEGALNDLWEYSPSSGTWTWVGGSSTANAQGVYGTQGVAAATNVPGARFNAASWTDASGNLWLFGGRVGSGPTWLNDLWEYAPSSGTWTWVGGSNTANALGVYGNPGVAAATNVPGARDSAASWTDASGDLWLFGGTVYQSTGGGGIQNDLWKYSPSSGTWTCVGGSFIVGAKGVYGTQGVAATTNVPGARENAASWTDASGNLWLFGGYGFDSTGTEYDLNDLWEYSPSSGTWTWISGSSTVSAASTNVPGARDSAASWTDASGNLWLFGGSGYDFSGNEGLLNDLWEYSPSSGAWTWVGGSNTAYAPLYGIQGGAAATNLPGARENAASWTDASGNLWLFGGFGLDSAGNEGPLNDLWKYPTQ